MDREILSRMTLPPQQLAQYHERGANQMAFTTIFLVGLVIYCKLQTSVLVDAVKGEREFEIRILAIAPEHDFIWRVGSIDDSNRDDGPPGLLWSKKKYALRTHN